MHLIKEEKNINLLEVLIKIIIMINTILYSALIIIISNVKDLKFKILIQMRSLTIQKEN